MKASLQSAADTPPKSSASGRAELLTAYFYTGWAFLIPYLLTYLLYLWQKWPANSFAPSALGNGGYIPALLHVYWALHVIHVTLAAIALRTWWRNGSKGQETGTDEYPKRPTTVDRLWPILPWLLLALIFTIPGVYLEWPSDPWEHFRRITEWSIHPTIGLHSAGYKSFYFFAYSLYELAPNVDHFARLSSYSTGISLLLAWQYYRLAMAVGLDQRWAFLFVLINVVTFGNVCFSFYKYYGLSSTMYSQLGAVALTRLAIAFAKMPLVSFWTISGRTQLQVLIATSCLVILVAFNHVQGLGIAALSIGSIIIWRLLEWKRSTGWWLLGAATLLSVATVLWWPRHPAIDASYRPSGWISAWYGFNLFALPSPATDRAMQILGVFGLLNLGSGLWLLRRNHLAGWLTLSPIIALALPFLTIPFVNRLAAANPNEIVAYHRMFFSIPSGLAFATLFSNFATRLDGREWLAGKSYQFAASSFLLLLCVISPRGPYNNRIFNLYFCVPEDLAQKKTIQEAAAISNTNHARMLGHNLLSNEPTSFILDAQGAPTRFQQEDNRRITPSSETFPATRINSFAESLATAISPPTNLSIYLPDRFDLNSPASQLGFLSHHWIPQEVALSRTGGLELTNGALQLKMQPEIFPITSKALLLSDQTRPNISQPLPNGLLLRYYGNISQLSQCDVLDGWLPFRRDRFSAINLATLTGAARYSAQKGRFQFKLRLLPAEGGADILLKIDTLTTVDQIYLIHHRAGDQFYFYVGKNKVGPWSPSFQLLGKEVQIEFLWADGAQVMLVNEMSVLHSSLPIESDLITDISIGWSWQTPDRALKGDILIQAFELGSSQP